MKDTLTGLVIKGVGGLYSVRFDDGTEIRCRARGVFRHEKSTVFVGDRVCLSCEDGKKDGGYVITEILPRHSLLLRPAIANTDCLFISFSPVQPTPDMVLIDKLIAIATAAGITPVVLITKSDLDMACAEQYRRIYDKAGIEVILCSSAEKTGTNAILNKMESGGTGKIYAFAGASGVGKSSVINTLFPNLSLETGRLSDKTDRGRHTTRAVSLFERQIGGTSFFVADTPGFSLVDFAMAISLSKEELPAVFPDFSPYIGKCRWQDCTHTKEDGCAIREAVKTGEIAQSRYDSFIALREELCSIPDWKRQTK